MKQPLAERPTNYPLALPPNAECSVTACRLGVGWGADLGNRLFHTGRVDTSEAGRRWSFLLAFEEVQGGSACCGHTLCQLCAADCGASMTKKRRRRLRKRPRTALVRCRCRRRLWFEYQHVTVEPTPTNVVNCLTGMVAKMQAREWYCCTKSCDPWTEGGVHVNSAWCCHHCWFLTLTQPHWLLNVNGWVRKSPDLLTRAEKNMRYNKEKWNLN